MSNLLVLNILLAFCVNVVFLQGFGSGSNGNLRLCIVEGRGSYKRGNKYCPVLDEEKSGVECVLGTDRLDCLRRISKGTVDFSALSPEDLVAAQWATQWGDVDVLVTNELRQKSRPFDRSIVAVVNRRILTDGITSVSAVLRNRTLCLPAVDVDDLRPLSEVLGRYLESLVTERSCDPELSLTENRIKATAEFFGAACKAGPWVPNKVRDAELKSRYPSLCEACATKRCSTSDPYWGSSGALNCLTETGDVTWAERDDVAVYFKTISSDNFAYLCHDGTWQPIVNNTDPCVWLHRPWNVVVAKRKAAAAVSSLMASLMSSMLRFDQHWHGALAALLESSAEVPEPVHPPKPPMDYLASAVGFREAYSQHGCNPPRHITLCTTSNLEQNKCEWLAEAGAVYGVTPPLQCAKRDSDRECMRAVRDGECDVTVADSDWLVEGMRDFSLSPLLHEATPIIEKTNTVFAYVRKDSKINKMADLRGKRAAFPRFDGVAWHSVLRYIKEKEKKPCGDFINDYFSEICAPGIENYNFSEAVKEKYTKGCDKKDGHVLEGELEALRSLLEGKTDVAFLSMNTYAMYKAKQIKPPTAVEDVELVPVCPEENPKYCFISWSNIGHIYAAKNLTSMKRNEIINVFTKLDQLFGKNHVHKTMFSMYGMYNHEIDVLFHNNTKSLLTDQMYRTRPYVNVPLSFERTLNSTDSCQFSDYTGFGAKNTPAILLILSLVVSLKMIS